MSENPLSQASFYAQVRELLEGLFLSTGFQLDIRLTGHAIRDAAHINIDPAMEALVRTERRLAQRMQVDLRELVNVAPPVDRDNLFITFAAESAQFLGGNATAFGIHCTRVNPAAEEYESLDGGIFVPGSQITDAYRLIILLRTPSGEVSLARTGVVIGMDESARLVAYQSFQFNPGLTITRHPPSSLTEADPQVMLYVFLTLSVFMMVNQGEARLLWEDEKTIIIG